jgi:magnesium chelatase family protein
VNPHQYPYYGDALRNCTCTPPLIQRYLARISGPPLDRIDLHIQAPAVKYKELKAVLTSSIPIPFKNRPTSPP